MNRTLIFLLTALLLVGNSLPRLTAAPATPEETIRGFYAWYVPAASQADADVFGKRRGELRRYVSARFLKEIDRALKIPGGVEADPFLIAQDFDAEWGKRIAVRHVQTQGDQATAEVTLTSKVFGIHRLRVTLVREEDAWKLDRVVGQE